jgi:hypothetical protein
LPTQNIYLSEEEYSQAAYIALQQNRKITEVLQDCLRKGLAEYKGKAKVVGEQKPKKEA